MRSILAAGDGFGSHLGGLGDIVGMGWVPEWPGDRQNGLDGTPVRAGALFYWDAGIQGTAKVEGGFDFFWPYCILFNIRQSAIRLGK